PSDGNRPPCRSRRRPFGGRGIRASQAAVADPRSDAETGAESPPHRSSRRRRLRAPDASDAAGPFRDRVEARDPLAPSSGAEDAEISPAVLAHGTAEAGSAGTEPRPGGRHRRHETAKSDMGVPTNRATDRLG